MLERITSNIDEILGNPQAVKALHSLERMSDLLRRIERGENPRISPETINRIGLDLIALAEMLPEWWHAKYESAFPSAAKEYLRLGGYATHLRQINPCKTVNILMNMYYAAQEISQGTPLKISVIHLSAFKAALDDFKWGCYIRGAEHSGLPARVFEESFAKLFAASVLYGRVQ